MTQTSLELVAAALAEDWKAAGLALEQRPPEAACARAVVEAYRAGRCEAWRAAWLLGAIGHADGYATTLEILRLGPGTSAESYAGVALVRMRGEAALPDLVAILEEPTHPRWVHEGAAFGLGEIEDPRALDVVLAAVDRGFVRVDKAGYVVHTRRIDPGVLLAWLRGRDKVRRDMAAWAVLYWSAEVASAGPIPEELRAVMLEHIARGRSPYNREQRTFMRERLAPGA